MCCRKPSATTSLLIGPGYVNSASGAPAVVLSGANAPVFARACSGSVSAKVPLTSRPVATLLGSLTDSVASPAVEITVAVVPASYVRSTPGVNAPKAGAAPSAIDNVGGTVPSTVPGTPVDVTRTRSVPWAVAVVYGVG